MKSRLAKISIYGASALNIAVVWLNQSLITDYYLLGFVYLTIPFLILANLILLVFLSFRKNLLALAPLLAVICSYRQITQNINISFTGKPESTEVLKIATYNVSSFYLHTPPHKVSARKPKDCIRWIPENLNTDILCLQEFHNDKGSLTEAGIKALEKKGFKYKVANPRNLITKNYHDGIVTFSKFPIIKSGKVKVGKEEVPRSLYTDIVVKNDTVRIINVHLKSMAIRIYSSTSIKKPETIYRNTRLIGSKLKKGFRQRNIDIQVLYRFIEKSPHKIILCGDFNDTPYSYSYQYIRKHFENAFEEAGNGFSFTYWGFPYFIRIDNQFYDPSFHAVYYIKHRNDKHSEHYPVEAWYDLNPYEDQK
jgi:endonuclease/exonuclease/phosphatase family metal-dependent hydrolase